MEESKKPEDIKEEIKVEKTVQEKTLNEKEHIMKKFPKNNKKKNLSLILASFLVVLAGVSTGWLLSGGALGSGTKRSAEDIAPGAVLDQKEAGIADESLFADFVEGVLEEGGVDGEGTHHLVREGGPSKYVYLTSTVIDLQSFLGKNVTVWGETVAGQTAGWLMDVGKIKVIE